MMSLLDGRIDCDVTEKIETGDEYYDALNQLDCSSTLMGRVTMKMHYASAEPFEVKNNQAIGEEGFNVAIQTRGYIIAIDTIGKLKWPHNQFDGMPLLVITSEECPKEYLDTLTKQYISWIAVGKGSIDLKRAKAGWKYGFVALLKDGTRVYSPITTSTYADSTDIASFEAPANIKNLWFVVSGAPTSYWSRDLINWVESTAEQWPYRVKFYQTNVSGNTNNYGTPTGICMPTADRAPEAPACVYSVTGTLLRQGTTSLEGLPHGVYIVNGRKVIK